MLVKTQIQLPKHLYDHLKKLSADKQISFAELIRRGAEYIYYSYNLDSDNNTKWTAPTIKPNKIINSDTQAWREIANECE
jgi:hypothetical protein